MGPFRQFLARRRLWACWLIAAALLMKVAVPTGFMPVFVHGSVAIEPCSGFGPEAMTMAMPAMADHHDSHGAADRTDKDGTPCGFAGHAPAAMTSVDPILLAIAIALIVATAFRMPVAWRVRRVDFLRPPLRGPPATR